MRMVDDHRMGGKVMGRSLRELLDGAKRLWDALLGLWVIGYGLLAMGYWILVMGYWLWAIGEGQEVIYLLALRAEI